MRDVGIIFRREMGAYFNSPIAYIFIVVFLLLTAGLYLLGFFLAGAADMRDYFSILPWTLLLFVPALTMRLWAEERRMGTFELLMTLPMRPWHIVLGKYLAGLTFYCIALAGTLTIPIALAWIGDPDGGAILSGYIGAILLGAMFLAVGTYVSALFRDQIAAFLVAAFACLLFLLSGFPMIVAKIDGWVSGLGTFIERAFGVGAHFQGIGRGVLDLSDIVYFVTFSIVFLVLNAVSLEGRKY